MQKISLRRNKKQAAVINIRKYKRISVERKKTLNNNRNLKNVGQATN